MSLRYRDSSGNETIVSGLTPGGDIEAGAVMTRTGTFTNSQQLEPAGEETIAITFDSPMPDADYNIDISGNMAATVAINVSSKSANGFTARIIRLGASSLLPNYVTFIYTATKTYTVQHAAQNAEDIANIKATIPSTASSTNKLATSNDVSSLNTSLGSRLDDVEDVIDATASITNKLVSQSTMQTAIDNVEIDVDDQIDATSENPVQNKVIKAALDNKENKQFTGTQAEWNALTEAQKKSYKIANITDDTDYVGNIVDTVVDGNMSAVTSNAVFDKFASISAIGDHTYDDTELVQIGSDTRVLARRYGDLVQISADGATFTRNNSYLVYDTTIPSKYMPTTSSVPAIGVAIVGGNPYITWISHDGTFIVGGQSALESTTTVYTTLVYFIK